MAENHLTTGSEQWKPVVGYEGFYEVSDHGRVRSMEREVTRSNGVKLSVRQRVLKLIVQPSGHLVVSLSNDGRVKTRFVHQLVLESFVGPRPEGMVSCHYDDNPVNNHISNLRWGTPRDNALDRVRNGLHNNARKTHCKRGHEYSPENTRATKNGERVCRECDALRAKRYREKRRAKELQEQ